MRVSQVERVAKITNQVEVVETKEEAGKCMFHRSINSESHN